MNNNLMNNKKGMSISIVLLVILTLLLVVITITYFIISQEETAGILNIPSVADSFYDDSLYFNLYLDNIFQSATRDFKFEDGKDKFIEDFKIYSEKTLFYSHYGYSITYSPIDENNIQLTPEKLILNMDITIKNKDSPEKGGMALKYNYQKSFEKVFK